MQDQSKAIAGRTRQLLQGVAISAANIENGRQIDTTDRHASGGRIGGNCGGVQPTHGHVKAGCGQTAVPAQLNRERGAGTAMAGANSTSNQAVLKCPRCNSLNTKFCYYNNNSLLQPRHFCKNCRRYWTKGGALRNVPVGGGCRKNKRSTSAAAALGDGSAATRMTTMSTTTNMISPLRGASKHGFSMMKIENDAASYRNSSSANLIAAVQKRANGDGSVQPCAALQESMTLPTHTHIPSLYSYSSSKTSPIQPSLSSSDRTQYLPLLHGATNPISLSPHQQASFHSFLNLKQAAAMNSFHTVQLPPAPFLLADHISHESNLQTPINHPFMQGLDLINFPAPTAPSTNYSPPAGFSIHSSCLSPLHQGLHHSNDQAPDHHPRIRPDHHQSMGTHSHEEKAMIHAEQQVLQAFGSSPSASKGLLQQMQESMRPSSGIKAELVSDNFKMRGDHLPPSDHPAAIAAVACSTSSSWAGQVSAVNSFLEPSGDEAYWSCNPSWPEYDLPA